MTFLLGKFFLNFSSGHSFDLRRRWCGLRLLCLSVRILRGCLLRLFIHLLGKSLEFNFLTRLLGRIGHRIDLIDFVQKQECFLLSDRVRFMFGLQRTSFLCRIHRDTLCSRSESTRSCSSWIGSTYREILLTRIDIGIAFAFLLSGSGSILGVAELLMIKE